MRVRMWTRANKYYDDVLMTLTCTNGGSEVSYLMTSNFVVSEGVMASEDVVDTVIS